MALQPDPLLRKYRLSLGVFVVGLILSGITAFPLLLEMRFVAARLDIVSSVPPSEYQGLRHWIAWVLQALETNHQRFPFLAYGTDWLAFGHLSIAVFFLRPFAKPLESDWVLRCG